jgi:hypothetical protein
MEIFSLEKILHWLAIPEDFCLFHRRPEEIKRGTPRGHQKEEKANPLYSGTVLEPHELRFKFLTHGL